MRAEEEIDRIDHAEKTDGFEYEADEYSERGQDRNKRCPEQDRHDDLLNPVARCKVRLEPHESEGATEKSDQYGDDDPDPVVA